MKRNFLLSGMFCLLISSLAGADPLAKKGELLFSDDFERTDLGEWKVIIPGFRVEDGVLKGSQDRADHGSVGRVYVPMKDVVMTFRFNLADSPGFNVVFDDKNLREYSHAGHVCRVAFAKKQIRLGDDKEGIMRNDIFKMRRNPETKKQADELIKDRGIAVKANLEANHWYQAMIEISGDEMRVHLDGELIGTLKSSGIAHPTKESVHFTVTGKEIRFDDVVIHEAVKK